MQMTSHFRYTRICYTMFGTLHRGTIQTESGSLDVLVKTWEYFYPILCDYQVLHHTHRIHDELNLLRDHEIRSHRNVVKLIGFHCARRLAVIYEDRHDELLENIIPTDTFSWDDRMKVATDIARMLGAFHDKGLVHGGVNSKYIMVDKEKCPVVFDFRLLSYCEDREEYEQHVGKLYAFHCKHLDGPPWSMKHDIFAYGILLLELINKNLYPVFKMSTLMEEEFFNCNLSDPKTSAVDDSFCVDEDTAMEFTKLAVDCLGVNSDEQPTMQCIIRVLKDLKLRCPAKKRQKISG
ncbi:probable LRR receptor-like serine/threonine-protein kinase At1g07560 [Primulina huaijiensis]|uniref:probable LRR receptor-like serine/threonine-protein kinase At1g07560 n=1 Tax=Primulina huaijiensis TaxID=1492673 RepID=UPI003CC77D09